ncbi:MAG: sulfurtransferase [Gammaproteobacteria bacterium]|nr:sulfurtransferase [Gammaproteobacteria bacterium]
MNTPAMPLLVDTGWLAANLEAADLRVYDCSVTLVPVAGGMRPESGRAAWAAAHIPGAGYLDLINDLSDHSSALPFMMPPAAQCAAAFGRQGIGPGARVVLYDAGGHMWATRIWWMLRALGFDSAAVLDGGLTKWRAEGRALSAETPHCPAASFTPHPRPGLFVDKGLVQEALGSSRVRLVNALSADEHAGRVSRTARPGRIPGSSNVPAGSLIDPDSGAYLPSPVLREKFRAAGALDGGHVVTYCGGGIAATSAAFTLVRLGVPGVSVYDGSLVEWSADDSLPMESG